MAIVPVILTLGLALWTVITFYLSWLLGFNQVTIILSTCLVLTAGWLKLRQLKLKLTINWWLAANLFFWAIWFGVIFSQMLKFEPDGLYAGWINVWGDWASHLSYASSFAYGDNFPPTMPLLTQSRFGYPFLADFFAAIWVKLGLGLIPAMLFSSWLWAVLLTYWLMALGRTLSGKLRVGVLTAWLFLLGGGWGWWWWLQTFNFNTEYTHLKIANLEWINIITSQVIPQRGFVMGFTLSLLIYYLLWHKKLRLAALTLITLPLIQAHALIIPLAVAFFMNVTRQLKSKDWWRFWLIVVLGTLPQLLYFYGQSGNGLSFIRWRVGWMASQGQDSPWWFWLKNLGSFWPLSLIGLALVKKRLKLFTIPFWVLFVAGNFVIWHPWEWDNSKFFTHWFLVMTLLTAVALERGLSHKLWLIKLASLIAFVSVIASGTLDNLYLSQYQQRKLRLIKQSDLLLADWVKINTPTDSLFLTADNHDHWLPVLTGRKIILGYKGWLWTYGLNYFPAEKTVNRIWPGGDLAKETLAESGVDYVVIGPAEKDLAKDLNQAWFDLNLTPVYQNQDTTIYRFDTKAP